MNVFIYPNLNKRNCLLYTNQAYSILSSEKVNILMSDEYSEVFKENNIRFGNTEELVSLCDVIVVIGGDGTILRCSSVASKYDKPILGLNCGTLGFMASLEYNEIEKLRQLCLGEYTVSERMMMNVTVNKADGTVITSDVLNDVVLMRGENCKIADFEVRKSGSIISALRADGVIFPTATGASAYSLSAGGPIIEPDMKCIEFSQICAHSLFSRTIVFSPDSELTIKSVCPDETYVIVTADGNVLSKVNAQDTVEICRSELTTKIIDLTGGSFFPTVNRKLMTPLKQ